MVKNVPKAAVDMALVGSVRPDVPDSGLQALGGSRKQIVTDITISVNQPEEMARDAADAIRRGYDTLKIKVDPIQIWMWSGCWQFGQRWEAPRAFELMRTRAGSPSRR